MTQTSKATGHVTQLETAERSALAQLPADLAALAQTDPSRFYALRAAQDGDRVTSAEFKTELKALRIAAIASDERQRQGHPGRGRPPHSNERKAYRQAQQDADESPDRAGLALQNWIAKIDELKTAAPEIAQLNDQADEQQRLCESVVKHLTAAADDYRQANEIADAGRGVMARHSDLVTFSYDPFIKLDESAGFLDALLKRVGKRLAAESERVGGDPDAEIAELRERQQAAAYKRDLDRAAAAYRKSGEGSALWKAYAAAMRHHEAEAGEGTAGDTLHYQREQLQRMLNRFYDGAAAQAGLTPQPEQYPQLG